MLQTASTPPLPSLGSASRSAVVCGQRPRFAGTVDGLWVSPGSLYPPGFWCAVTGLDDFLGYVATMAKQTPEDLRRYAARYIVGKNRVTGVLIAPETRKALKLTESELTGGTP